jgi:BlaI family transcriptional regulator, penicillinase repressor
MARPKASQPTELELEILEVLWRRGPSTARQLHQTLPSSRKLSISSVHIAMRSMAAKGYLREERRKKSEGGLLYSPLLSRDKAGGSMLGYIVRKIFGGMTKPALQRLLSAEDLSEEDLDDLGKIIREKKRGTGR